jgi:hypothetical protein
MTYPIGFQPQAYVSPPAQPSSSNSSFEEKVLSVLKNLETKSQIIDSHTQSIAKLETQIVQLASAISRREEGKLPSCSTENPRGLIREQTNAIMVLRSGNEIDNKVNKEQVHDKVREVVSDNENYEKDKELTPPPTKVSDLLTPSTYEPRVPYPQALEAPSLFGKSKHRDDILETFKQVKINLPLLDVIQQIPAYAKFLKDMCTFKRRSRAHRPKKVVLSEQVSSILQCNTPPKFKDPGIPTISCHIGNCKFDKALLDLGSSINLIPYSVYEELGLGELQPANCTLQLADRSVKIPRGRIDDVLVKVDKGFFPVDFIVLDMEPEQTSRKQIPIILGRPFLATADANINCRSGVMDISVLNMRVKLNIFKDPCHPSLEVDHEYSVLNECGNLDVLHN